MTAKQLFEIVYYRAKEFGLKVQGERGQNSVVRENLGLQSFSDGSAYFGFIRAEEEITGVYSDFCFVVFPDNEKCVKSCVVSLAVGSQGFKNDYPVATLPGLLRSFSKLRDEDSYFKTSLSDIENYIPGLIAEIKSNHPDLKSVINNTYKNVIQAARIVCFPDSTEDSKELSDEEILRQNKDSFEIIFRWLATYAKFREWPSNKSERSAVENTLSKLSPSCTTKHQDEITKLLDAYQFVVLQGAPGTGKTWNALKIAESYDEKFFTQFHAETSYSDFVDGIVPNLDADEKSVQFVQKKGILCEALEYAKKNPSKKAILIIDEINRANLSNVLGPIFYLFEKNSGSRKVKINICGEEYTSVPDNLHVIATMNTADRSLAVVDFALRRRFVWYTLRPEKLSDKDFDSETFEKFANIFFEYATDEELNLQPGQSYFMDKNKKKETMRYRLMPLIKEYLAEGYLLRAKEEFVDLFFKEAGALMYE